MSLLTQFFQNRHKQHANTEMSTQNQTMSTIFGPNYKPPNQIASQKRKAENKPLKTKKEANDQKEQVEQQMVVNKKNFFIQNRVKKSKRIEARPEKIENQSKTKKILQDNEINKQEDQHDEKQKEEEPQNLDSTIFVGNIPLQSTRKQVKKYFEKYGKISKVWFRSIPVEQSKIPKKALHILKMYQQGADSMNAYVKFENQSSAQQACQANGQQFNGKNIKVTLCTKFDIDYQTTIFIGNLSKNIKDQQVWDAFKPIGKVKSVRVIRNNKTFEGIGIGYVRFQDKQTMKKAIQQMNGKVVAERPMRIKKAVPKQRLEKKFKKLKQKKDNKFKNVQKEKTGKGVFKNNKPNYSHSQQKDNKFSNKTKQIKKDFKKDFKIQNNNNKKFSFPKRQQEKITPQQSQVSGEVIRTKVAFEGKKIRLQ